MRNVDSIKKREKEEIEKNEKIILKMFFKTFDENIYLLNSFVNKYNK